MCPRQCNRPKWVLYVGAAMRDAQADVPSARRLRAQLAFKDSVVRGILQFTPSIAFRYVLHRCESRDIRCRESFSFFARCRARARSLRSGSLARFAPGFCCFAGERRPPPPEGPRARSRRAGAAGGREPTARLLRFPSGVK